MTPQRKEQIAENIWKTIALGLASVIIYFLQMQLNELKSMKNEVNEVKQWEVIDKMQHNDFISSGKLLNDIVREHERIIQKNINKNKIIN